MKSWIAILLLPLFFCGKSPRADKENVYTRDFHILVQSLRELDPMLYHVIGKDSFELKAKIANTRLENVTSTLDAIYIMQEFMFELGDAHAAVTSSYGYLGVKRILPFKVHIIGHHLYVKECPSKPELNGREIYTIDGVASAVLIDSLKIFYPNDGKRDIIGFGLPALFNSLYSAFCHESNFYSITTSTERIELPACKIGDPDFDRLVSYSWTDYMVSDSTFRKELNSDYAYFRFSNFARMEEGHNIEKEFDDLVLAAISNKTPNFIIDLRFNSGGDPYIAGNMAAHFTGKPFRIFERLILTETKKTSYSTFMVRNFAYRFRHVGTEKVDGRREKVKFERGLKEMQPSPEQYTGNIYVITGAMTGSSATMLCKYLQDLPNVKFVGTETEGSTNYFCAHKHCELTLPETRIYVNFGMQIVELKKGSCETEKPVGIIPANSVNYTIGDLMNRYDLEMNWIRGDIRKSAK